MLQLHVKPLTTADNFGMKRLLILLFGLILVSSCTLIDFFTDKDVVAEAGKAELTRPELERILPKNLSAEDSLVMAKQYITSWAKRMLLYNKAMAELSNEDKNVDKLLQEYKMQLLIYRYQNKYLSERLDTVVSDEEGMEYYNKHKELFVSQDGAARGRYLVINKDSKNLKAIQRAARGRDEESVQSFEELASTFAVRYENFNDAWLSLPDLSKEMGCTFVELKERLTESDVVELQDSLYTKIFVAVEKVLPGRVAPYEYSRRKVREIFLGRRKQELIAALEEEIYSEALKNNELIIVK